MIRPKRLDHYFENKIGEKPKEDDMLDRYTRGEVGEVWSEESKFRKWLLIEVVVLQIRRELGELEYSVPPGLIQEVVINPEEINQIEQNVTKHDVLAFLNHVSPQFPEKLRPWLHKGLTSYDIGDTALSLQMKESVNLLIKTLGKLMKSVKEKAFAYKYTPQVGRTHGVHAEPITFGVKLANWYDELKRHHSRLQRLKKTVSVGKISGAVGMYTIDPEVERMVCKRLGLKPIIATQIISRDIAGEYMATLGLIAASVSKIALNLRLLARTEVREVMEFFDKKQKGSSAMPHKKNPIGSENICGLMRVVCSNAQVAYENLANCWDERSLDNSGAERVAIADSSILLDYALARLTGIINKMLVFPKRMLKNLGETKGLIFSQEVMMLVAKKSGLPREEAHTLIRDIAVACWESDEDFIKAILRNKEIMWHVTGKEVRSCFKVDNKLRHVNHIFNEVFGGK